MSQLPLRPPPRRVRSAGFIGRLPSLDWFAMLEYHAFILKLKPPPPPAPPSQ